MLICFVEVCFKVCVQGRVVKKAKRRNLTEDQKKNVFAGFGGFTSSNTSAAEAFSFLGKAKDEDGETKSVFAGFKFGEAGKESEESKKKDTNGEPKKTDVDSQKEETVGDTKKPDDLFAKFMTKSGGNWSCDVCMISNPAEKTKCVACETPNTKAAAANPEESKAPPAKSDDLMAKFLTKPGANWTCDVCMISNNADKAKCAACETPNPAASKPVDDQKSLDSAKPTFNFGSGGGFKFVDDNASKSKSESPFSSFKFGSSEPAPVPTGDFTFGASSNSTATPTTGGFKFGASEPTAEPAGGFKFGSSESSAKPSEPASGFSFGSNGTTTPFKSKTGFSFSSTGKVTFKNCTRPIVLHSVNPLTLFLA